jgi:AraC-like DNA-binding protein
MGTVPSLRLKFVVDGIRAATGNDPDTIELCKTVGIDPILMDRRDARLPFAQIDALFEEAAAKTGDSAFGLHMGERWRPAVFDVLGYAITSSPTLRAAFEQLRPCLRAVQAWESGEQTDLVVEGDLARFTYQVPESNSRHHRESYVTAFLQIARVVLDTDAGPFSVAFEHAAPVDLGEHERIFRAPVAFSSPINEIVFPAAGLYLPLARADRELAAVMERHAKAMLQSHGRLSGEIRWLLASTLPGPDVSLEAVALTLKVGPRTLQRRLRQEGTSYEQLLDTTRRDLSLGYLAERRPNTEVSRLLGYSNVNAFCRAFQRWTGVSPGAYRRRISTRPPPPRAGGEGFGGPISLNGASH